MAWIRRSCVVALSAATALLTTACASDYHYSQLVGRRYFHAPVETYPLSIVAVDGKGTNFRQTLIEPGRHDVTVQGPAGAVGGFGETRTVAFDVAPCTRYYLVAVKSNPLNRDFDVKVDFQEPVAGCTPPSPG